MRYFSFCILFTSILECAFMAGCQGPVNKTEPTLPYYTSADFTPHWPDAAAIPSIHRIPAFSFVDQQGRKVTEQTIAHKITVVDFFFASCPGICKRLTRNLSAVQQTFLHDDNVLLLSHSVTPERDSVPVLNTYARTNGIIANKWRLLTGERSSIYRIARSAYFADEDMGMQQDSSTFLHTENVLLIDRQQHIRGIYKGTLPAEIDNLIADIKKLEASE